MFFSRPLPHCTFCTTGVLTRKLYLCKKVSLFHCYSFPRSARAAAVEIPCPATRRHFLPRVCLRFQLRIYLFLSSSFVASSLVLAVWRVSFSSDSPIRRIWVYWWYCKLRILTEQSGNAANVIKLVAIKRLLSPNPFATNPVPQPPTVSHLVFLSGLDVLPCH